MKTGITLNIPIPDRFGNDSIKGKLKFVGLTLAENLEMVFQARIDYFEYVNGSFGRPIAEVISANKEWSDDVKAQYTNRYRSWDLDPKKTAGNYVDAKGLNVEVSDFNELPAGAMPELEYWQLLGRSIFDSNPSMFTADDGTISSPIYNGILLKLYDLYAKGKV